MSILPRIHEGHLCVPLWEVPLIWSWSAVMSALVTVGGVGTVVSHMIGFESISDASVIALFAGAFIAAFFTLFMAYYSGYKKQIKDAAALKAKKARGAELTVDEEVDIAKAEKFDLRYSIALFLGIIMAGGITIVITSAICTCFAVPDTWVYYGAIAFVVSVVVSAILDEKVLHKAADGTFRSDVITPMVEKIEAEAIEASKAKDGKSDTGTVIEALYEALGKLRTN